MAATHRRSPLGPTFAGRGARVNAARVGRGERWSAFTAESAVNGARRRAAEGLCSVDGG
jgi:hypothetical protein